MGGWGAARHAVQFYEGDAYLLDAVAALLDEGLRAGGGALVVATSVHRDGLEIRLARMGHDLSALRAGDRYVASDAAATLTAVSSDGGLDLRRFEEIVGSLAARAGASARQVRVFSDMAQLLWSRGDRDAALRLEEVWGSAAAARSFRLLCAYRCDAIGDRPDDVDAICRGHDHVIPAESYTALPTPADRLRAVASLQQKYRALEAEVARRRRTEAAARERERETTQFLEHLAVGVDQIGSDGRVQWANPAQLRLLGLAEGYVGRPFQAFHTDPVEAETFWRRLLAGESIAELPMKMRGRDGAVKHVVVSAEPFFRNGVFVSARRMVHDVTLRVETQIASSASAARLKQTIDEIGAAHPAMIERERLAAVGTFARGVVHDFNNALAPVLGFTDLLLDGGDGLDPRVREDLLAIRRAAQEAADVAARLRNLHRAKEGRLIPEDVRLDEVAAEALVPAKAAWAELAGTESGLVVVRRLGATPPVDGNRVQLRKALDRLLTNAVQSMPSGGELTVETSFDAESVTLRVVDTGTGMPPDVRARCLEPYFSTRGESGLGLSSAQGYVTRHCGTLEIESAPGVGTEVRVRFPRADVVRARPPEKLHALVVDDEQASRDVIAGYLTADGHTLETAHDGADGLERFRAGRFDLVITDCAMPVMDGETFAMKVKQLAPQTPVIMLSGLGGEDGPDLGGVDRRIRKPLGLPEWRRALATVVERKAAPD